MDNKAVLAYAQRDAWATAAIEASRGLRSQDRWDYLPTGLAAQFRRQTSAGMRVEESTHRFYHRAVWEAADKAAAQAQTRNDKILARIARLEAKVEAFDAGQPARLRKI